MDQELSFMGLSLRDNFNSLNQEVTYTYTDELVSDTFQLLKIYGFVIDNNIYAARHLKI